MKNYLIECEHNVYVDSYQEGEGENVNNFSTKGEYTAQSPIDAIELHLKSLCFDFDKDNITIDEEQDGKAFYSTLCDVENSEASKNQIEVWIKGELTLYANNMTLFVYELSPAIILIY